MIISHNHEFATPARERAGKTRYRCRLDNCAALSGWMPAKEADTKIYLPEVNRKLDELNDLINTRIAEYSDWTTKDLLALAKKQGQIGYSKLRKHELVRMVALGIHQGDPDVEVE